MNVWRCHDTEPLRCGHSREGGIINVGPDLDRVALTICCATCLRPQKLADLGPADEPEGTVTVYGIKP